MVVDDHTLRVDFRQKDKLTMPTLIDRADNQVNQAYGAWPDRLYVVGVDGKIAYQGGPGPGGFKVAEVEKWLSDNVK